MKAAISAPKTAALKTRAVTKVLVDALAALLISDESDEFDDLGDAMSATVVRVPPAQR